ncbi:MAG: hypothetical protein H7096_04695 [Flavobacterium sp.]|nr:hypothetical protein [Pedobacter sp.]
MLIVILNLFQDLSRAELFNNSSGKLKAVTPKDAKCHPELVSGSLNGKTLQQQMR